MVIELTCALAPLSYLVFIYDASNVTLQIVILLTVIRQIDIQPIIMLLIVGSYLSSFLARKFLLKLFCSACQVYNEGGNSM